MKAWFLKYTLREQLALLAMAAAVILYLVFVLALKPMSNARTELARVNVETASQLQRVDAMAAQILSLRAAGASTRSSRRNLSALLNQSAERFALSITRLQPNSRGAVQLRIERAPLESLLRWIHMLETQEAIAVEELSFSQTSDSGVVSASLRLAAIQ